MPDQRSPTRLRPTLCRFATLTLLSVAALPSAGCLTTPNNQQFACGVDEAFTFQGFTLGPGQTVLIQIAEDRAGPWTTQASTVTNTTPITFGGIDLYAWSATEAIATWDVTTAGFHTYVRARTGTGLNLITFDHPSITGGVPPVACINNEMSGGANLAEALGTCKSGNSPVIEIHAPFRSTCACAAGLVTTSDVLIETPGDLAQHRCLETIDGNLEIRTADFPIVDLPQLAEVTGNVTVDYAWSGGVPALAARLIEADALATVGGDVHLDWNDPSMVNPNVDFALDGLSSIDGDLTMNIVNVNYDAIGLGAVTVVGGDVQLLGSTGDIYGQNLVPVLADVTGSVTIEPGYALRRVFEGLERVGGDFVITGGFIDTGYNGLDVLSEVGGDLRFESVDWAPIDEAMPALSSVGGALQVTDGDLSQLSHISTAAVQIGELTLDDNADLTALDGNLTVDSGGAITITNNTSLDTCDAETFVADQAALGWPGTATISGNSGSGC
ncbi:MAG: hypothetical protein JKY37_07130 [Nannocystaceae bacterium]|nr:hypothetical protein [Nannocystaceae bacterium]